ncbi:acyl-CoA dehydrogenase C-terminal domain-containing protein [Spartinivicinus poritis]|uniref:Acyl-CoA dehydrogenase C-terminal domain-containing protein n=1 Tax=Spartinivicinus poritis TaxID=2994640 RepID=A0ABT5UDH9_9GAMM|nr:acyl-CoA dehydrogenase C-terminal domain-containing protein [Spartinivicinus sp. A2-2]MDE1463139.1 acyl-CoA dehydrogenase C-terminal domain-containing protein [Spartinivicinus sp. A2-2]
MAEYQAPITDMQFVLYDVFKADQLWSQWESLAELVERETADAILEEAGKLATNLLAPINRSGDEEGVKWDEGKVTTPSGFKEAHRTYAEGGWVGLTGNPEYGGMGMPKMLAVQVEEMGYSANNSFMLYQTLSSGACLAIDKHATEELKTTYLEKIYSGEWSGSMCLTEPHAGTDLGIIRTKAEPQADGSYLITGTKIFITGGEHDLTGNIIHLVLAKLPDAPAGSKGISLFLVPKLMVNEDGSLSERNAVHCGSIEHKMGIKASSTCVMNFDGAKGYLVGEVNRGLVCMFTMMNYERLSIGIQGLGCSEMSYQKALSYAKERIQGKTVIDGKRSDKVADPIIGHADVRRMLLNIKAMTEAGRAFSTYVAMQLDTAKYSADAATKASAEKLVALLTPITKAFFTDIGLDNCVLGQQVYGGHGYIREWGQEQLVRDVRIAQIYEGTNGIQALDLMGRKVVHNKGEFFNCFADEVKTFISNEKNNTALIKYIEPLERALNNLVDLTNWIIEQATNDVNEVGAASVEYLHVFGYTAYSYMWALMVKSALEKKTEEEFFQSKLLTANYFNQRLLPRVYGLTEAVQSGCGPMYEFEEEHF